MFLLQDRLELLLVQPLGIVEPPPDLLAHRLVALGNGIEEVAHRHNVAKLQPVTLPDENLKHHLERRALPLQQKRHFDQRVHESRTERIDHAELLAVGCVRQQHIHDLAAHPHGFLESHVDLLPRGLRTRAQHTLLGNRRQIAVSQLDRREARLPPVQRVAELQVVHATDMFAHQFLQVALPGHKTDQRDRPVCRLRLHQVGQLRPLPVHKRHIRSPAGQPEDQFIQEEHDRIVPQSLGVPAHDRQPVAQFHEPGRIARRAEEMRHQVAHQPHPLVRGRRRLAGRFKGRSRPTAGQFAPVILAGCPALVHGLEEFLVAQGGPQFGRIRQQPVGPVETRHRRFGMELLNALHVTAQNGRLHAVLADHVVREQEETLPLGPVVVRGHHRRQRRNRTRPRVALQQQVQHGHEMTFAAAETAVQITALARLVAHGVAHQPERLVETGNKLVGNHVLVERLVRMLHAFGKMQHEVAAPHAVRQIQEVANQFSHG